MDTGMHSFFVSRARRALLVVSLLWLLVAMTLYFPALGTIGDWPAWYQAWHYAFPLSQQFPIFNIECPTFRFDLPVLPCSTELSVLGLLIFITYPLLLLWLAAFGVRWVLRGKA